MPTDNLIALALGLLLAIGLVSLTRTESGLEQSARPHLEHSDGGASAPQGGAVRGPIPIDLRKDGPFLNGQKVSFQQAETKTTYDLPIPPESSGTGSITGIWSQGQEIAFVWDSDMRFYVSPTGESQDQILDRWAKKTVEEPDVWSITTARGRPALAAEGDGDLSASSISFLEGGLYLQLISPQHTVEELKAFAGQIE